MTEDRQPVYATILMIYLSIFLDNTLLTIIVPILPYLLHNRDWEMIDKDTGTNLSHTSTFLFKQVMRSNIKTMISVLSLHAALVINSPDTSSVETEKAAVLLSSKSIIQLATNPLVAVFLPKVGYLPSLLIGNILLLITSLAFSQGDSFLILTIARGLHGVASAIILVSGISICAENFSNDDKMRSKYMGIILGGEALGVLTGYTVGPLLYNLGGKSAPFALLTLVTFVNTALLLLYMDTASIIKNFEGKARPVNLSWCHFLKNPLTLLIFGALFFSSSTVAVLEPSLPVWLIENMKIEKWQTGLIFLPDSCGYLISTNFFSTLPYRIGKWKTATLALCMIGVCLTTIPSVSSLFQLAIPYFCAGLGFGIVDIVLIPMLANIVDLHQNIHYSSVYALQQGATSLAYIFGSLVAGELVQLFGFSTTVQTLGASIILYSVLFFWYDCEHVFSEKFTNLSDELSNESTKQMDLILDGRYKHHHLLFESDESD